MKSPAQTLRFSCQVRQLTLLPHFELLSHGLEVPLHSGFAENQPLGISGRFHHPPPRA